MPIWLIEFFGAQDLNEAFLLIALMTAPIWFAMIAVPGWAPLRAIAQPLVITPIYALVWLFLIWQFYQASVFPEPIAGASYDAAREFTRHPMSFLALFCNLQIINLCMGTMIYQKALRHGFRAPVELLLCWGLGVVGVLVFALRLMIRRAPLK